MAFKNSIDSDMRDNGTGLDLLYHLESDASRKKMVT